MSIIGQVCWEQPADNRALMPFQSSCTMTSFVVVNLCSLVLFVSQDAINMQINNLARDNLHDKLGILSDLVTDEFWPWFANYMVVKRAAQVGTLAAHTLPFVTTC